MNKKKESTNPMTEKNNNLSSAQEVVYQDEFKKADKIKKEVKKS